MRDNAVPEDCSYSTGAEPRNKRKDHSYNKAKILGSLAVYPPNGCHS